MSYGYYILTHAFTNVLDFQYLWKRCLKSLHISAAPHLPGSHNVIKLPKVNNSAALESAATILTVCLTLSKALDLVNEAKIKSLFNSI